MIADSPDGVRIAIRVIPRASKSGLAGTRHDALLVRLHASPVEGAANDELVRLLSDVLGIARRDIAIVAGGHSRSKIVRVAGIDVETCRAKLLANLPTS